MGGGQQPVGLKARMLTYPQMLSVLGATTPDTSQVGPARQPAVAAHTPPPPARLLATHSPCFPPESQQTRFSKCGSHRKAESCKQTVQGPFPSPGPQESATLWIIPSWPGLDSPLEQQP